MDAALRDEIRIAAQEMRMPDQDVIRLAIRVGLERFRRINYDLVGKINEASDTTGELMHASIPHDDDGPTLVPKKRKSA